MKNKINAVLAAISAYVIILAAVGCCWALDKAICCFFPGFSKWFWFVLIVYLLYRDFLRVLKPKKETVDWDKVKREYAGHIMAAIILKSYKNHIWKIDGLSGAQLKPSARDAADYASYLTEEMRNRYEKSHNK